jgi:hypothetical protein
MPFSIQKLVKNTKNELLSVNDSGAHFSVSDTEFEGGDDGHGHGNHTFLAKQAQPSHTVSALLAPNTPVGLIDVVSGKRKALVISYRGVWRGSGVFGFVIIFMAGLGLFFHKSIRALAPSKGFASICLCFFVLNLHKKVQGIAKWFRAGLIHA